MRGTFMNYELIKIIQIGFNVLVMGIASSFYMKMLTSKPSFKQHKSLYHTSCILIMLLTSLCVERSSIQASFQFMLTLGVPLLLFFKDKFISRVSAYFMILILETFSESIVLSIFTFINIFFPETEISPQAMALKGLVLPTLFCHTLLIIFFTLFCKFLMNLMDKYFHYIHIQTLLFLSLPFFLILFGYNIVSTFPHQSIIQSTIFLWIVFFFIFYFLLRGLNTLENQNTLQLEKENRKKQLMQQAEHYEQRYHETLLQRRWAHDLSNHISVINYMIDHQQFEEAKTYLKTIIKQTNETFKEEYHHEI